LWFESVRSRDFWVDLWEEKCTNSQIFLFEKRNMTNWKLESDVNYWVLKSLESLGLRKGIDFNDESAMSDYMKDALQ
jgi:restriction enzyme bgcI alpha subunit